VDACLVTTEVSGAPLLLVVADASLLTPHFLLALRKGDPNRPVLAIGEAGDPSEAALTQKGVAFHVRPLNEAALILAVSLAHAEGRAMRRSTRHVVPRLPSTIEGESAVILDVSDEGVRLEVGSSGGARRLSPQFIVHVPVLKMGVPMQRVWVRSAPGASDRKVQCGASLLSSDERTLNAWKRLSDPATGWLATRPKSSPAKVGHDGLFGRMSSLLSNTPIVGSLAQLPWKGRS
jgi:hypothetical protein